MLYSIMYMLYAGKILRVESIKKKVTDSRSMITNLDPDTLYWTEGELVTTCFVYYTRILYLEGEPTNQQIGETLILISTF